MATGYILYNEKAGTGKIADAIQALNQPQKQKYLDASKGSYHHFRYLPTFPLHTHCSTLNC